MSNATEITVDKNRNLVLSQIAQALQSLSTLLPPTTVSELPAPSSTAAGTRASVTDATATTFHSVVAGGGSNFVPVINNGTDWLIG